MIEGNSLQTASRLIRKRLMLRPVNEVCVTQGISRRIMPQIAARSTRQRLGPGKPLGETERFLVACGQLKNCFLFDS